MSVLVLSKLREKTPKLTDVFKSEKMRDFDLCITWQEAQEILDQAAPNRVVKKINKQKLIREMALNWQEDMPDSSIWFNEAGKLANGNHRLSTQVFMQKDMKWHIWVGVPQRIINAADGGITRTHSDRLHAYSTNALLKHMTKGIPWRARQVSQTATYIHNTIVGEKYPSLADTGAICAYYKNAIMYVLDIMGGDNVFRRTTAMISFVLAYKWAEENDVLQEYLDIVPKIRSGKNLSGTALTLRNYILAMSSVKARNKRVGDSQWVCQMKTMRALQAILTGEPDMTLLKPVTRTVELREWFFGRTLEEQSKKLKLLPIRSIIAGILGEQQQEE